MVVIKGETQTYLVVNSQVILLIDKFNTDNWKCLNSFFVDVGSEGRVSDLKA